MVAWAARWISDVWRKMWSSARPVVVVQRVMYGVSGWSAGITDRNGLGSSVRWCISRCLGVGMGDTPMVCWVDTGACAWKSPIGIRMDDGKSFYLTKYLF